MKYVEVVIYEGEQPIGTWVGRCSDPTKITVLLTRTFTPPAQAGGTVVSGDTLTDADPPQPRADPIENLARRSGVYTEPTEAMKRHQLLLEQHAAVSLFIHKRVRDADELSVYSQSLNRLWWDWHDDKLTPDMVTMEVARVAQSARATYATWLMNQFSTLGVRGRDARYTIRTAIAAYKRKKPGADTKTIDTQLEQGRARLDLLRGTSPR